MNETDARSTTVRPHGGRRASMISPAVRPTGGSSHMAAITTAVMAARTTQNLFIATIVKGRLDSTVRTR